MDQAEATKVVIPSEAPRAHELKKQLVALAEKAGFSQEDCFAIQLTLDEALSNAIHHGNCGDPEKKVEVKYRFTDDRFEATICDEGCGFEPGDLPDPRADENLTRPHGRGVLLMRSYMHEVRFSDQGRCVHLVRKKNTPISDDR
ncbi:MAG: ATP-binding protein [Phycisphaeraceae bacterium]